MWYYLLEAKSRRAKAERNGGRLSRARRESVIAIETANVKTGGK